MADIQHQVLPNGSRIGVYEIRGVQVISHFSIIYKGWNHHLSTTMAIEEYLPLQFAMRAKDGQNVEPKSDSDSANYDFGLTRFVEQAEKLMKIEHPNVGGVHNVLQVNGTAYVAMDYEDGLPLARLCDSRKSKFDEDELKVLLVPILKALQKVHEQGFFHGAVIPANILLRKDGEPVLINFAAARLALASQSGTLPMILSKGYAPIEQYEADSQYGPWTDLYTLGATLYHCMLGKTPEPAPERISAVNNNHPDPQASLLQAESNGYGKTFLETIDSMLAVRIEDRPPSAAAILAALETDIAQPQEPTASKKTQTLTEDDRAPRPTQPEKANHQRLLLGSGIGLLAATFLVAGLWYLGQTSQTTNTLARNEEGQAFSNERSQTKLSSGTALNPMEQTARSEPGTSERSATAKDSTHDAPESVQTMSTTQGRSPYPAGDAEVRAMPSQSSGGEMPAREFASQPVQGPATSPEAVPEDAETKRPSTSDSMISLEQKSKTGALSAAGDSARETIKSRPTSPTEGDIQSLDRDLPEALPNSQQSRHDEVIEEHAAEAASVPRRGLVESKTAPELTPGLTPLPEPEKNPTSEQTVQPTGNTVTQQDAIEQHMAVAQKHLAALRLSTPQGENALEHYRVVLSLAPEHPGAREGLEQIAIRYGWLIDKSIKEGELRLARVYLNRAEEIFPGAHSLLGLRTELEAAEAAAQNSDLE